MERPLALVVDKDPVTREALRETFERHDVRVLGAESESEAEDLLASQPIAFLILDLDAAGGNSLRLARHGSKREHPPIVIGLGDRPSKAVDELLASGGFDVLLGPLDPAGLRGLARRALHEHALQAELRRLERRLQGDLVRQQGSQQGRNAPAGPAGFDGLEGLPGRSPVMMRLRERIRGLAGTRAPVWFIGEPGAGKELAARALHAQGGGAPEAFVVIPCAGVAPTAWGAGGAGLETLVERARGGCVYLDGLPALAHVLQERLTRLLSDASRASSARWLASSLGEPQNDVEQGRLLEELRRALDVERVTLAPLRERTEDVPLLAQHVLGGIREINRLPPLRLAPEAIALLERHRWPGNVGELQAALEQAVILAEEGTIRPEHLPESVRPGAGGGAPPAGGLSLRPFRKAKRDVVEAFEQSYLRELMQRHAGNVTAASQQAGMLRSALQRLLRKYFLKSSDFRKPRRGRAAEEAARTAGD